ncbi:MAG: cell filamentation protein Fic [Gordonia sp.]|uniref:Fic/DOC family protein n=1 Tax=Williamsia sp. 1138 TaxID=1903117 RepID=UPI000A10C408|nr:Fic family protein [Williamsia sp. 1138]MBA4026475.1 cell filamentation protein Fic [Gordonia sp. (in: high G+C Gram-positive bacteria)]OZG29715.1 cell filamentation protein Fic [Williamsia sp. 1138]
MPPSSGEAGPVPENLLGISDPHLFREFERAATAIRIAELDVDPDIAAGDFDFAHLQRIHHYIFKDVYQWAGQQRTRDTGAMGLVHCRPDNISRELDRVFGAIATDTPPSTDPDAAAATVADHWGELTSIHPFTDGNSRSQRVFFTRYIHAAGWDIDWKSVNASAMHAARHVAMATVDSRYLAAELRPGVVPAGTAAPGSLTRTQGQRDNRTSVDLYYAMRAHKRTGLPATTFRAATAAGGPLAAGGDERPASTRGRADAPPRVTRPGSVSSQPRSGRGQGR